MTIEAAADQVRANREAWTTGRYEAWTAAFGPAPQEAERLVRNPDRKLRRLKPYLGNFDGVRICNVQGSNGRIAVALALRGGRVTVLDFSEENRRYALELAEAAKVEIDYRLGDVMEAAALDLAPFDLLVMELGILHYHQDLKRFFQVMAALAKPGARLVLEEFHPVKLKLFPVSGTAKRDYFHSGLVEADAPDPTGQGRRLGQCLYRFWSLGEVVTAVLQAGFSLVALEEHPDSAEPRLPGSYVIVARR